MVKDIVHTKHVRSDESKVGYEYIHGNTTYYYQFQNRQKKSPVEKEINLGEQFDDSSEQSEISDEESETSHSEHDVEPATSEIVGASVAPATQGKRKPGRPKKVPRNPYGRKGKPQERVELNLTEVLSLPQARAWDDAIEEEIGNLERPKTWVDVELPPGRTCIGSKWVFKIKKDEKGHIASYKARPVAQGFG